MSKKPKTPDVAAVWHEVKGISNGLAALRITVACNQNEANAVAAANAKSFDRHDERIKRLGVMFDELQLEIAPRGFNRPPGNSVTERLDRLESERLTANRFASGLSDSLEKHAEQIGKHNAWLAGLQNAEIDAQGIGEQIGDLEVKIENLQPLHAAVSMLEAKVAALTEPRSQSERMRTLSPEDSVAALVKMNAELCRISQLDANRICILNRECGTVRSVVTVLVIVQAFTTIAGLAWVLGGGW